VTVISVTTRIFDWVN